jgi:hypothetical protein
MKLTAHLCLALLGLFVIFLSNPLLADDQPGDSAKAALRKRSYPWYDAQNDSYKSLRVREPRKLNDDSIRDFGSLSIFGSILQIGMWVILGILVAGFVILLVQWIRNYVSPPDLIKSDEPTAVISVERLEALPEKARGVHDLLGEAERLASSGAYAQAMTFYYSWQLTQLDRQAFLELQRGKTNRQYLNEVKKSSPELSGLFRSSIRLFEDAFFGHLEISKESFDSVWSQRFSFQGKHS